MKIKQSVIVGLVCVASLIFMVGPAAGQKSQLIAKSATPVVTEIDADKLKKLLQRDTADARPLLVNFWATWCGPCREEYPDLVKLDSQFKGKGLDVVTISLDDIEDIKTKVPEFLTEMHAQMPAYLLNTPEPEAAIAAVDTSWSGALPATFLYNRKGEVVYKTLGRIKPAELSAAIEKAMSEK